MSQIEVERDGAVTSIAINRPEKKNALTADMYDALSEAVEEAEADAGVRVLLLHGKGDALPRATTFRISCRSRGRVRRSLQQCVY